MNNIDIATKALVTGLCLQLTYGGNDRVIEVHACGFNKADKPIIRAWQVGGESTGGESTGWKLLLLDKAENLRLLDQPSQAPRQGFKPSDRAMQRVLAEVSLS